MIQLLLYILAGICTLGTLLPLVQNQHWIYRTPEFAKTQINYLSIITFAIALIIPSVVIVKVILGIIIVFHSITLIKYTSFYPIQNKIKTNDASNNIKLISTNVYQFNTDYKQFQDLIARYTPDIFITLESNKDWELQNRILEKEYPYNHKVTLENTYGMHLYSKLPIVKSIEHYFVADDIPSIEAHIKTKDGYEFVVFGVHPPPPSPTEEINSKERDGELLSVAKQILKIKKPVVVVGDLNNVAWAKSSILFKKTGQLIDPRIGRGLFSTFHAKYWFLRFPIDHIFHTTEIFVDEIKTLENINSDHFPLFSSFWIDHKNDCQEEEVEELGSNQVAEVHQIIKDGINEESENRSTT